MGREHTYDLGQRFAPNDEFLGPDKFYPRFNYLKPKSINATFSPSQIERRTLYFEGDPAELVHTQNRFNMLQKVWEEHANPKN